MYFDRSAKRRIIFSAILILAAGLLGPSQSGQAQYRNLPKANFQTFTQPGGSNLPASGGLHLRPGESRTKANQGKPYDPRHLQLGVVRWERSKMPIHVWISPGLKLPEGSGSELRATRVDYVRTILGQKNPLAGLEQVQGWTEDMNGVAAAGIEEWREFETEGLISFDFTEDPKLAHILVFWTNGFSDDAAGGTYVHSMTFSQPVPVATMRQLEAEGHKMAPIGYVQAGQADRTQNPVVIELSTDGENRLRGAAAHEFGHALGIIEHSPYREDLMYVDRIVSDLSPGDKATFRLLYRTAPQGDL